MKIDLRAVANTAQEVRDKAQRIGGNLADAGLEPSTDTVSSQVQHLADAVDTLATLVKNLAEEMQR